jgi:hypothetical protein
VINVLCKCVLLAPARLHVHSGSSVGWHLGRFIARAALWSVVGRVVWSLPFALALLVGGGVGLVLLSRRGKRDVAQGR